jgi:signal transduction histidine kinase
MTDDFAISTDVATIEGSSVMLAGGKKSTILTIRATSPLTEVTGFRLRFIPVEASHVSGQKTIGRSDSGSCVINEFQIQVDPLRSTNIALGRPVRTPGPTLPILPPSLLTDGFPSTFSHPNDDTPAHNFYFEVDLGSVRALDHIVLLSRLDGLSPSRLSDYEVQLLDDASGQPGKVLWSVRPHRDGSYVPSGGSDTLVGSDGAGERFSGRFIRIVNATEEHYRPQVGEVEVYPDLHPSLTSITADGRPAGSNESLPPDSRSVSFAIIPDSQDPVPELQTYRWRRPGGDGKWTEAKPGETVLIPCYQPGTYPVEFQARHTDGAWNKTIATHLFVIPRPWWQRPLRIFTLLASTAAIVVGLRWRHSVMKLQRKLERAQATRAMEQDRLRIARDMHDDVGARLTHLALLADRVKRSPEGGHADVLTRMAAAARETVSSLDQIVWAVNPKHDTLGSLIDYIGHYATEFLTAANLSCRFDVVPHDRAAVVPFSIRHPLLMAFKEALQNVVKHAGATRVTLMLRSTGECLEVSVTDDGTGIEGETDPLLQDGLNNMKSRIAELGGLCTFSSPGGTGTRVEFFVPLKKPS